MAIDGSIIKVEVGNTELRGMCLFSQYLEFMVWYLRTGWDSLVAGNHAKEMQLTASIN